MARRTEHRFVITYTLHGFEQQCSIDATSERAARRKLRERHPEAIVTRIEMWLPS
jgi:hypothetical protein